MIINLLIAILLFVSWTLSFSLGNLFVVIIYLYKFKWRIKSGKITFIIIAISVLSLINLLFGITSVKEIDDSSLIQLYIPYLSLLLGAYIIGDKLDNQVLKFIVYLTAIESIIVILQYITGNTGFGYNSYTKNETYGELLYYSRPNGLSTNSSIVAQKLMISLWLLLNSKFFTWKQNKIVTIILLTAIVLTFNRTVILTLIISYFILSPIVTLKQRIWLSVIILPFSLIYINPIKNQILRGSEGVSIESFTRYSIYKNGLTFIKANPIFGNNSVKYFYEESGRIFHLHNSYLETAASNGIPIFLGLVLMLFFLLKKKNFFLIPLIIYSLFQFGIFWGISFLDIALFFNERTNKKRDQLDKETDPKGIKS